MESRRALLKALLFGGIPTIAVWVLLLWIMHPSAEDLPGHLLAAAFTVVVVVPLVYFNLRHEGEPKSKSSPKRLKICGFLFICLGLLNGSEMYGASGWHLLLHGSVSFAWIVGGILYFHRAHKSETSCATSKLLT